ncbi:MAG: TonB-dependent receptor [Proteobacteria bacterium]|nr:TonB-dependent receptor [Pseudomonadota bacterium]
MHYAFSIVFLLCLVGMARADETDTFIEEVTIVGERAEEHQVTGAAQYIGDAELEKYAYSDIQRVLRQVPGVSIQVEDGYGLRPNISIRGVATERSGRITLLEDNVLIAPAPYSAPAAYYFPTVGRMHGVEILKGPAAITQGPYTIGGAMNLISTPIPRLAQGKITAEAAEDATYRVLASYGATLDSGFAFLAETHQWQSDGFQRIDRGGDSGLDIEDYTLKLGYSHPDSRHRIELKLQYADQDSDQSYLGLTDSDFEQNAYRRYGVSALDHIKTEHEQQVLRYLFEVSERLTLRATAYNNEYQRNWFKTEGIDFDGSVNAETLSLTSWFSVVQAVNQRGTVSGMTFEDLQAILNGADTAPGSIQLRANARTYFSRGVQLGLDWSFDAVGISHEVTAGLRFHEDEEDRLQRNSSYRQSNGRLVLDDIGLPGNAGNRIQEAEAVSVFLQDRIEWGDWVLTPGMRYEDIDQARTRFETRVGRTVDPASRAPSNFRDSRGNQTQVFLPGMGVMYAISEDLHLVAGAHKGFTAPSNSPGVRQEEAINYELGFRYGSDRLDGELIVFYSDYENLLGECTASSGAGCTVGDAFNGDAATVTGFELRASFDVLHTARFSVPVTFNYTYINGEFDTDIADTDFFGDVRAGDPIPYIPRNQFNLGIAIEGAKWNVNMAVNRVGETCVRASCGTFERTESALSLDLAGSYDWSSSVRLFARLENVTGEHNIMGRHPYGARPNKDRTAAVGVRLSF